MDPYDRAEIERFCSGCSQSNDKLNDDNIVSIENRFSQRNELNEKT